MKIFKKTFGFLTSNISSVERMRPCGLQSHLSAFDNKVGIGICSLCNKISN